PSVPPPSPVSPKPSAPLPSAPPEAAAEIKLKLNEDEKELASYLTNISIPEEVKKLAEIGIDNYKKASLKSQREKARKSNSNGGGRQGDWIKASLGTSENELVSELEKIDPPKTWTIGSIDDLYNKFVKEHPPVKELPQITLVKGFGVNYLHDYPMGKDAIVQLASQFNYLEAIGPHIAPVASYLFDNTQGPMGSIEALSAALHREAAVMAGKLSHALHNIISGNFHGSYKDGYLEAFKLASKDLKELLRLSKDNIKKIEILAQWALCEASGNSQLQVFSAAPSYQGAGSPSFESDGGQLCDTLVSAQYEAIAKLAVIRSILSKKEVVVHLTLVGQNAFNNPPEVMKNSFKKYAQASKGYPLVKTFIHGFGQKDQNIVRDSHDNNYFRLKEITAEDFKKLK
ncbi:MAG: hypothetical protein KC505_02650, partial [Myxococcales bacterium]|nr:hypothetical protein [Myxococcales bacterium]